MEKPIACTDTRCHLPAACEPTDRRRLRESHPVIHPLQSQATSGQDENGGDSSFSYALRGGTEGWRCCLNPRLSARIRG